MSYISYGASDAEKEQSYRSGFRHAVAYLLKALECQLAPDQMVTLRNWESGDLEEWYRSDPKLRQPPPMLRSRE